MEIKTINPLILAYIGDAVLSLFVRDRLLREGFIKVRQMHEKSRLIVSARYQAKAARQIEPDISETERMIFMRGRNSKATVPKSATVAEYRAATGLEALFGYLHLKKNDERLNELMEMTYSFVTSAICNEQTRTTEIL